MGNFPTQPPPELYKYSPNLPHIHLSKEAKVGGGRLSLFFPH
uniref:Uncharacterized protein n=1 Tax=Vitis vinifera TaxID=29760 RepID=F6H8X1_VITVI